MRQLSFLIKPASSLCNMKCTYCFYEDVVSYREVKSKGIMNETTMVSLINQALHANVDKINFCFQGGEPTLAGIDFFKTFIHHVNKKNKGKEITYAIQTNGLLINDEWLALFSKHHFLVGISLDGFIENHDTYRLDMKHQGTFSKVRSTIHQLEKMKIEYNILTVLTRDLSKKPKQLFDFYLMHHLNYIQIIPCLPPFNKKSSYALQPEDFSYFYKTFFDLWYEAYQKGHYISVTLFDNVIEMYLGVPPSQCGMLGRCQMQFVVEGDGSVYPCDFYVLEDYCCGNIQHDSLEAIINHPHVSLFINENKKIDPLCLPCPFYKMCYGNCKRMSVCMRNDDYCGYQDFLNYSKECILAMTRKYKFY